MIGGDQFSNEIEFNHSVEEKFDLGDGFPVHYALELPATTTTTNPTNRADDFCYYAEEKLDLVDVVYYTLELPPTPPTTSITTTNHPPTPPSSPDVSGETAIQKHRRRKKEKLEKFQVELVKLDETEEEMIKEMRELKGGIQMFAEITKTGEGNLLLVQDYIDKAVSVER